MLVCMSVCMCDWMGGCMCLTSLTYQVHFAFRCQTVNTYFSRLPRSLPDNNYLQKHNYPYKAYLPSLDTININPHLLCKQIIPSLSIQTIESISLSQTCKTTKGWGQLKLWDQTPPYSSIIIKYYTKQKQYFIISPFVSL